MQNQVAWVTGGGSGIGEFCCRILADRGARVLCTDIDIEDAERVAEDIRGAGGIAEALQLDVGSEEDNIAAVARAVEKWGALHIVVLNAGMNPAYGKGILETSTEEWRASQAVNFDGVFFGIKHAAQAMVNKSVRGDIVVTGSTVSSVAMYQFCAYGAAKYGSAGLARMAACDLAPYGISVNVVAPGPVRSKGMVAFAEREGIELPPTTSEPDDIAGVIVEVLATKSNLVTGQIIHADHGLSSSFSPTAFLDPQYSDYSDK